MKASELIDFHFLEGAAFDEGVKTAGVDLG